MLNNFNSSIKLSQSFVAMKPKLRRLGKVK